MKNSSNRGGGQGFFLPSGAEPGYNCDRGRALFPHPAQKFCKGRDRIYILGARIFICRGENFDIPPLAGAGGVKFKVPPAGSEKF